MRFNHFLYDLPAYDLLNKLRYWREWRRWKSGKSLAVPHYLKRETVGGYAKRYGLTCLVETGTYFGEMVDANKRKFSRIVSIELDDYLFGRAARRFSGHGHIEIMRGDSATVLPKVLETLACPALFWLDAHYSGGITAFGSQMTPILEEIRCILRHPVHGHVILVDDARLFDGTDGYPHLQAVSRVVEDACGGWAVEIKDDILRIVPRESRPDDG
jgi:hypothetical protein